MEQALWAYVLIRENPMKKIAILALLTAVAGGAFAQADKKTDKKPAATPKTISCAVQTGDKVDIAKATKAKMYADYKGKRYFFCCGGCPTEFAKNPAKYAKNASIPTPKADKKAK